ncbi:MAG: hypothetical protein V3V05_00290 [Pontiella sp.]
MKTALDQLMVGEISFIMVGCNDLPTHPILMPGSFNPLHAGHEGLLLAAEKTTGHDGILELSVTNVDKPSLTIIEVERRLLQLKGRYSVVLTCAPTFAEKAELFPGASFAMGYDTALRLLSAAYHNDVPAMLQRFQTLETRFIVAGRLHDGVFQGLDNLNIPTGFESLFIPIPENIFREDISSTELRSGL